MKFVRYLAYLLYSYYSKGSRATSAYFNAICFLTFLILIHLFIIALIFDWKENFSAFFEASRGARYLIIFLIALPIFLILYFFIKEQSILKMKEALGYDHFEKEFNHRQWLFLYTIFLLCSLVVVALGLRRN